MSELAIEKIGTQLFYVEVSCYRHIKAAIEQIEREGMSVNGVTPLMDYDFDDDRIALRAALIFVAGEARELKGGNAG